MQPPARDTGAPGNWEAGGALPRAWVGGARRSQPLDTWSSACDADFGLVASRPWEN